MDWNEFFTALKNEGVIEITLKFSENKVVKPITTFDATNVSDQQLEEQEQVRDCWANARANRQKKFVELRKELHEKLPNYYSAVELARITNLDAGYIGILCKQAGCEFRKIFNSKFYNIETLWLYRTNYEDDILKNDGHRKGGVKMFTSTLEKLIK